VILLLTVCGIAGLATGRVVGWMARRKYRTELAALRREAGKDSEEDAAAGEPPAPPRPARVASEPLVGFPCQVGDVVVLAHGEEAWLAGALTFGERAVHADASGAFQRSVAALFVAPDKGAGRAVYAKPDPESSLDWMWPLPATDLLLGNEPPSAIEHEGVHFERVRRLPLLVARVGEGSPDVGASAVIGEYEGGAGARLLVVIASSGSWVWRGRRLEAGMFDLLPQASA
jgi:hypothetical protein